MDHQHHQTDGASDVHTDVSYNDGEVRIQLEDVDGNVPKLEETHEEEMHLIIVSNDLEDYIHLHPEREEDGIYTVPVELEEGHYQAFVDISPEDMAYQVAPNPVQVGTNETGKANLSNEDNWTKEIEGKTVTLEDVEAKADEEVPLVFDMHGENPEPHMGALGHVVIVDEDGEEYIHVHPDSDDTTSFQTHFPEPGMYKIWAEFKFDDDVNTYPFIIEVNE
ncbi:hypothetical protein HUG20_09265 [Salicibibacter cibi]|uniref:Secreted protein n=2 Tax=Salicibibacter cibi TaxID=2743001 RepID=A0A7T6ZEA1_9BACI|nr:hypothetical protein HUG20_09265 [Salicibibacter cibi]